MKDIIFVHGMFQNPKSWEKWTNFFSQKGYNCIVPAWPYHEGTPSTLRINPPEKLGELSLNAVIAKIEDAVRKANNPIMIGHSVGGLITQILLDRGVIDYGVAINSVAPNGLLDFDWSFIKNVGTIANPLKGDEPIYMDEEVFHGAFANTLDKAQSDREFFEFATHDSRNVLRDCMGEDGRIDFGAPHRPLLLIAGEKDEIIPTSLVEKNYKAYEDKPSVTAFKEFPNRSHYICNEPGWEEVASFCLTWLEQQGAGVHSSYEGEFSSTNYRIA